MDNEQKVFRMEAPSSDFPPTQFPVLSKPFQITPAILPLELWLLIFEKLSIKVWFRGSSSNELGPLRS